MSAPAPPTNRHRRLVGGVSSFMGKVYRIFRRVVADGKSVPVTDHDLTPQDIIDRLDLRRPQFEATARYGHFGNGNVWDVAG